MKTEIENYLLLEENKKMRELIEFAHNQLSGLFNTMDEMDKNEVKNAIGFIGTRIESFVNQRK